MVSHLQVRPTNQKQTWAGKCGTWPTSNIGRLNRRSSAPISECRHKQDPADSGRPHGTEIVFVGTICGHARVDLEISPREDWREM